MSRRSWLLAGLGIPLFRLHAADNFSVRFDGDNLYPVVSSLHFLTGKPLDRLKAGDQVAFIGQLTLLGDDRHTIMRKPAGARFILSWDIWDERFKVTIPNGTPRDKVGLSAAQAEAWCLDNLALSTVGIPPEKPCWLRFELTAVAPKYLASVIDDGRFSIASLVDFFSQKAGVSEPHWTYETPRPFRLQDLPRPPAGRPTRVG